MARLRRPGAAARSRRELYRSRRVSSRTDVMLTPSRPHATTHPKRLEVVVDVDREAVGRHAARDVDADRRDLALLRPDAGVVGPVVGSRAGLDPGARERGDDRLLDRAEVRDDVDDAHDRIADELAGAVVGQLAAAVDVDDVDPALAIPVLAERQLARQRPAPARVDRRVLEQQQRVRDRVGLARGPHALLQRERLAVLDDAELADPQLRRS